MEGIDNFRELGGLRVAGGTVRRGVLYRSAHLAGASDADVERLEELGIRTVVDLRVEDDLDAEGHDRLPDSVEHHWVPIHDEGGRGAEIRALIIRWDEQEIRTTMGDGRAHAMAAAGAAAFARDAERLASFAGALRIVADPDLWPVLWHCSAGKDRAGWVATALLLGLGAEHDVIVDHYVESNRRVRRLASLMPEGEIRELVRPFLEVHEDYVRAQLEVVDEVWGDAGGLYDRGFGLDPSVRKRLVTAAVER